MSTRQVRIVEGNAAHVREDELTGGVPRAEDDAAVGGVLLDFADALRELVDALPGVVRVAVRVLRAKVPPLKSVHRTQVALSPVSQPTLLQELLAPVSIPDLDALR